MAKWQKFAELKNRENFKNEIGDSDWRIIFDYSWSYYFIGLLSQKN